MYNNTNRLYSAGMQNMNRSLGGHVRVLHAVPDAPAVDIYANDEMIAENLAFGEYTEYLTVPQGTYNISLYVAGSRNSPVLSNMLTVNPDSILTVAAAGTLDEIGFIAIHDSNTRMDPGMAMVRFAHLSPNAPAVDITLPDGTVLFNNVSYKHLTPYIAVRGMRYTLQVRLAGTETVVLTVPNVNLQANNFYTVYAIGLAGEEPELQALLLTDYRP